MSRELFNSDATVIVCETELEDLAKPDPEVFYTIRFIDDEKWREIQNDKSPWVLNRQTGRRERVPDWSAISDNALDYLLVDWKGIVSRGQPAPCTRDQKMKLDGMVKGALFALARTNQTTAEDRERSFREPADVRGTVD